MIRNLTGRSQRPPRRCGQKSRRERPPNPAASEPARALCGPLLLSWWHPSCSCSSSSCRIFRRWPSRSWSSTARSRSALPCSSLPRSEASSSSQQVPLASSSFDARVVVWSPSTTDKPFCAVLSSSKLCGVRLSAELFRAESRHRLLLSAEWSTVPRYRCRVGADAPRTPHAFPPDARANPHLLRLRDFECVAVIGEYEWNLGPRSFAALPIDLERDKVARCRRSTSSWRSWKDV
jgi:hypothetical protein